MKVVHIAASLEDMTGGPAYIIPALVSSLAGRGVNSTLLSIGPQGDNYDHGFRWQKFSNQWRVVPVFYKLQTSTAMKKAVQSANAELIHSHGLWLMPNIYGSLAKTGTGGKLVTTVHGMLAPDALRYSKIRKQIFGFFFQDDALSTTDMFHATSAAEVSDIRHANWTQPIALIPLGVEVPKLLPEKMGGQRKTVLYLGRVHPIKRLGDLLEAWRELSHLHPDWQVLIVGPDECAEQARLKAMIAAQNINRVELKGPVFGIEKSKIYNEAHLYVLPSQSENFSMTVAEALAHALPVICSKGAPWSGLEQHQCGWWSKIGKQGFKTALADALTRPAAELAKMGENGREWVKRDFSLQTMSAKMEQAYHWLLNGGDKPDFVNLYEGKHD